MKALTEPQIRHLGADLAAQMLTRASDPEPEQRAVLMVALKAWLPEADPIDLREVSDAVASVLAGLATLVDERKARMVGTGQAAPYG